MKQILFLILTFSLGLAYSLNDRSDNFNERYEGAFEKKFQNYEFYEEFFFSIGNNSVIIPVIGRDIDYSVNNISDKWLRDQKIDHEAFKARVIKSSKEHLEKTETMPLTAQIMGIDGIPVSFCFIYDNEDLVTKRDFLVDDDPYSAILVYHEIEHCGVNTNIDPIVSKEDFIINASPYLEDGFIDNFFKMYSSYLQEMYADIASIHYLMIRYPDKPWVDILNKKRAAGAGNGDFFHDSRDFINEYTQYSQSYTHSASYRDEIKEFVRSRAGVLMPIPEFIKKTQAPGVFLPLD